MPYPYASTVSSGTAGPYAHGTGTGIGTGTRTVPVPGTVPVPVPTRVLSPTVDDAPRLILDLPRAPPRLWHAEAPFLEPRTARPLVLDKQYTRGVLQVKVTCRIRSRT
jgi:hypothetical protein